MYNCVEYHPCKYNSLADILSRNSVEFNINQETCNQSEIESVFCSDMHVMISTDEIKDERANDKILCQSNLCFKFDRKVFQMNLNHILMCVMNCLYIMVVLCV